MNNLDEQYISWVVDAYENYLNKCQNDKNDYCHYSGLASPNAYTNSILSEKEFIEKIKTDSEFAKRWEIKK
jgi:hypothetical protein